ncbi:MAG: nucleotidyltransferase domain-containing protein [Pyrobaculum sp.]
MSVELFRRLWERRAEELDKLWHTLERLREAATKLDPEARVYVFGSFARGTARPDSDVDVLVVTELASTEEGRFSREDGLGGGLKPPLARGAPHSVHGAVQVVSPVHGRIYRGIKQLRRRGRARYSSESAPPLRISGIA